jgi:hypothetical protein
MADRPLVTQVVQIGVEAVHGTPVAASKRLLSLGIDLSPSAEIARFAPVGYKYDTQAVLGRESATGRITGPASYTELLYLLNSCLTVATGALYGGGAATYRHVFSPAYDAADTVKSLTIERGQSAADAEQAAYALVNGFTLRGDRNEVTVEGDLIARALTTGFTMTAGANEVQSLALGGATGGHYHLTFDGATTGELAFGADAAAIQVALRALSTINGANVTVTGTGPMVITFIAALAGRNVPQIVVTDSTTGGTGVAITTTTPGGMSALSQMPVVPTQVSLYVDDTYATIGTTKLLRDFSWEFAIANRFGTLWPVNASNTSWAAHVEKKPDLSLKLALEADSAGAAFFTAMRAGATKYVRVEAIGPVIEAALTYRLQIDFAGKVIEGPAQGGDDVLVWDWTLGGMYDDAFAKAFRIILDNNVSAI